mgnify:CR=1 FL=1
MIKNIIFDFDGVLVDSEILVAKAFAKYLQNFQIDVNEREFASFAGKKTVQVIDELSRKYSIKDQDKFFTDIMKIASNIYKKELTTVSGAYDFVSNQKLNLYIGSNSMKERIVDGLQRVDLRKYFKAEQVYSFDMVDKPKPDPDIYLKVIEDNNLIKNQTIIIEDSAVGVMAGVSAGIKVIGLTAGGHWHENRDETELLDAGAFAVTSDYKKVIELDPKNAAAWGGLGSAYGLAMYPDKSAEAYAKSIELKPDVPNVLMGHGHALKTLGNQTGALDSYRAAIKNKPDFGEVYWSMANLKVFNFEDKEVNAMLDQLEEEGLSENEQIHFRFALGKAFEDKKDYSKAWHYYHTGNQLQRTTVDHFPVEMEMRHDLIKEVFNQEFLKERSNIGYDCPDPILIVGLPRSGSTLIEQILASHSQVEGTSELPILGNLAQSIGQHRTDGIKYPRAIVDLRNKDLHAYGQQYIDEAQRHRITNKPFFTDKLPNNFSLIGLLSLILPNAKVINARRHPFDSCLGAYKQLFSKGQNFTYDMLDLAHYYQQYDAMIKHWHQVLPGKILDVHYEQTVDDLDTQVRRILDFCELPFEQSCIDFHQTERAVKTASSEQVRQPIYRGALGTWRRYEQFLELWQEQLSDIIEELPQVSKNAGL